ncbi:MAG: response regulator [Acidimicrobiia bacterium]
MAQVGQTNVGWPIVVIDDDELARALVVQHLRKLHLRNPVIEAVDGEHAYEVLRSLDTAPALVLLDVHMPHRSGLELLEWMRSEPRFADVPVVMLTVSSALDEVDTSYELGVISYLVKPVGYRALDDVLRGGDVPWVLVPGSLDGSRDC